MHNHKMMNMVTENNNNITNKYISDNLSLVGIVVIENGKNKVIGRNHWVGQGLETIGSYLVGGAGYGAASNIYVGSDTLIPTTVSLTGLISPIGSSPGTAPNTFNVSYSINTNSTIPATVLYTAVWNAGTVSGTLGEVGLYLQGYGGLSGSTYATNPGLGARMASADGAFTPFTITTTVALTVSWFIRFVYSSETSVTQYITNPNLPSDPSQQPIVGITNSQNIPVPAGLQVMWQAPVGSLQAYFNQYGINLNSDLSNMRILYNGQYVPAWIESINNGIATIWMKTPVSIPANSSISLSLNAGPSFNFDGVYWGEAPQLSSTYGQYDNGASIFNFYDNFAGTSLNMNLWSSGTNNGTIVVNNGIHMYTTTLGGSASISFVTAQTTNNVIREAALNLYGSYGSDIRDRVNPGLSGFSVSDMGYYSNSSLTNQATYFFGSYSSTNTPVFSSPTSPLIIDSQAYTSAGNFYWNSYNYGNYNSPIYSASATFTAGSTYMTGYAATLDTNGNGESSMYIYFVRIRAYPSNGVMPSVSLL